VYAHRSPRVHASVDAREVPNAREPLDALAGEVVVVVVEEEEDDDDDDDDEDTGLDDGTPSRAGRSM
jgi:hypothetical protein